MHSSDSEHQGWPTMPEWPADQPRFVLGKTDNGGHMCNFNVPALNATPDYQNYIQTCMHIQWGTSTKIKRSLLTKDLTGELPPRKPSIQRVELHEGFDVIKTGGTMGSTDFLSRSDNEKDPEYEVSQQILESLSQRLQENRPVPLPKQNPLIEATPRMIEDFTDILINAVLRDLQFQHEEMYEIRRMEQELRKQDTNYRVNLIQV